MSPSQQLPLEAGWSGRWLVERGGCYISRGKKDGLGEMARSLPLNRPG